MNVNLTRRSITLPARGTVTVDLAGTFLLIYGNTGSFKFSVDGGGFNDGFSILSVDVTHDPLNLGKSFKQLVFQDTSGSANTISFIVSTAAVTYINALQTNFTKDAATYIKPSGVFNIADAGITAAFTGIDTGGQVRKHFIVANPAGNPVIYAANSSGTLGDGCPAGQSRIYATSGAVYLQNTAGSGAATAVTVLEIFYS